MNKRRPKYIFTNMRRRKDILMTTTVWMAVLMMTMFTEAYSVNNNYNNNNNYRRSRPEGSFISLFNEASSSPPDKIPPPPSTYSTPSSSFIIPQYLHHPPPHLIRTHQRNYPTPGFGSAEAESDSVVVPGKSKRNLLKSYRYGKRRQWWQQRRRRRRRKKNNIQVEDGSEMAVNPLAALHRPSDGPLIPEDAILTAENAAEVDRLRTAISMWEARLLKLAEKFTERPEMLQANPTWVRLLKVRDSLRLLLMKALMRTTLDQTRM